MAGRGSAPGERRGGRRKGSVNKINAEVADQLAKLGCNPIEGMARYALGDVPCDRCRGSGKATYLNGKRVRPDHPEAEEGVCDCCFGTCREPLPHEFRGKMYAELAQYVAPKRKAIEHSTPDEGFVIRIVGDDASL